MTVEQGMSSTIQLSIADRHRHLEHLLMQVKREAQRASLFVWVLEQLKGTACGPLAGLGFVVKDSLELKGSPLYFGTNKALIAESTKSAAIIQLFEELGACCLAKCSLDEACLSFFGDNPHTGEVINPLDPARFPGGSSGSVAVAVQKSIADFGLGSDFGGSIRIPAAACGIVGLKLSSDTFPRDGALLYDQTLDSFGILTRNLSDLGVLLDATLGSQPGREIKSLMIPAEEDLQLLQPAIAQDFKCLCDRLQTDFEIVRLRPGLFLQAKEIRKTLALKQIERQFEAWQIDIGTLSEALQAQYRLARLQPVIQSKKLRGELSDLKSLFENPEQALLSPTLCQPMPKRCDKGAIDQFQRTGPLFLYLANLLGLPALSFPCEGLSVQLAGSKNSERHLWQLANHFKGLSTGALI